MKITFDSNVGAFGFTAQTIGEFDGVFARVAHRRRFDGHRVRLPRLTDVDLLTFLHHFAVLGPFQSDSITIRNNSIQIIK